MMSDINNKKIIIKKNFDFEIPAFLDNSINELINAYNSGSTLVDCYISELYNDINNCMHGDLTDEQLDEIRDYYIRGGMYEEN